MRNQRARVLETCPPGTCENTGKHAVTFLRLPAEHAHEAARWWRLPSVQGNVLRADPLKNDATLQLHDNALVDQLIDDQDDSSHIIDQTFPFNVVLENLVEALVDGVQHRG